MQKQKKKQKTTPVLPGAQNPMHESEKHLREFNAR